MLLFIPCWTGTISCIKRSEVKMKTIKLIFILYFFVLICSAGFAQVNCEGDTEPPVVLEVNGPTNPVELGEEIVITASFMDDCGSPHTVIWNWGELNYPIHTTVIEPTESEPGQIIGRYVYSFPGVYAVSLTVIDDFENSAEALFQFVVIYSSSAGFVTGGGWIESPEGAYTPDTTLTGKANFGFVAKYKKGKTEPEGNTQFSFKVANLEFKSTSYEWLVIAGPQAKFKGSGTINGSGDYGFMLTGRDGQVQGGGGEDRFRIKIWEKDASETVIYDNQMNDPDDGDATDAIEGGSIVIHETTFDETPPVVIITSPFDVSYTNQTPITISWMVDGITQTTQLSENLVEGTNIIIRSATDEAGNIGADTVTVIYDITPPIVAITSPEDSTLTNQTPIDVIWMVDGIVQGNQLTSDLVEGENLIIRSAEDEAGNVGADTVQVILDTIPPEVVIGSPEDSSFTNQTPIDVTWTIDGLQQTTELSADLLEGENLIIRTATDSVGNVGGDTLLIILDTIPPVIALTAPVEGLITHDTSISVTGTVSDQNTDTLMVNEVEIDAGADGSFSVDQSLNEGTNTITVIATDAAQNSTTFMRTVICDTQPPDLTVLEPADGIQTTEAIIVVSGTVFDSTEITLGVNWILVDVEPDGSFSYSLSLDEGPNTIDVVAVDAAGNSSTITRNVTYESIPLPPDPATVAPPIDSTVVTTMYAATEFLYTGENPIQTGVDSGTIEPKRTAVLRGKVLNRDNDPLSGVTITILNHPEFGQTLSRADGWFDMAVNGGGDLIVFYTKESYLPVQRPVKPSWNTYDVMDDVVMIQLDPNSTVIDFSDTIQVARGSLIQDERGTRQATLLFKQGTTAEMVLPDSSVVPLETMTVHITEYTVGENGRETMPAPLPPGIGYTYCVEFSVEEALQAGTREVRFDQPQPFYTDNFLGFPSGAAIPVGKYDETKGAWLAQENALVINIVDIQNDMAQLDTNNDGLADHPDTLALYHITDDELKSLAELYLPGQSVWRAEISHFCDINASTSYPDDFQNPNQTLRPNFGSLVNGNGCNTSGSIIGIQDQTLGERIPVTGTDIFLNYRSDHMEGRLPFVDIRLSDETLPGSVKRIELDIEVAGQKYHYEYAPQTNLIHRFIWDRKDAYGRTLYGSQNLTANIQYIFDAFYSYNTTSCYQSWRRGIVCKTYRHTVAFEVSGNQQVTAEIGSSEIPTQEFGGWSSSIHHRYDLNSKKLIKGDGSTRTAENVCPVISTVPKIGENYTTNWSIRDVDVTADGSLYVLDESYNKVYCMRPDSTLSVVAGTSYSGPYNGDNIPATKAKLYHPYGIAVTPDGILYIADTYNHRIRKVDKNGIITTIAGTGIGGFSGDDGLAVDAQLNYPYDIAISPYGDLYISDGGNYRIRKISPDGIIMTIAGTGVPGFNGDNIRAIEAKIYAVFNMEFTNDGSLYFSDYLNCRIRKITQDGIIMTVAGTGNRPYNGDGIPAIAANLSYPSGIAISDEGYLYITDSYHYLVRVVSPDGIITTIAGNRQLGHSGDGGSAKQASISHAFGIAIAPDGAIYFADYWNNCVRKLELIYQGYTGSDFYIPSEDGNEVYQFSAEGRHLSTLDALTSNVKYAFSYNENGLLSYITDMDSLVTTIERDGEGNPTAILSPFGQRTTLTLDSSGYLESITNPAGETVLFTYTEGGLMTSQTDARGNKSYYAYDELGRLIYDEDPAGGFKTLSKTDLPNGWETTLTSAEGMTQTYRVERLPDGSTQMTNTFESGLSNVALNKTDGTSSVTFPDGTVTAKTLGPDPRFGMEAPLIDKLTVSTPGGLTSTMSQGRIITQISGLEVTGLTDTVTVNGKSTVSVYEGDDGKFTTTSPEGRNSFSYIDDKCRVVQDSIPGIHAVYYTYDDEGFLIETEQGGRRTLFSYNDQGQLESITDPFNRITTLECDSTGRLIKQVLADGREIVYDYDANGNLISLTPPGRHEHTFSHTVVNLTEQYVPPVVPDSAGVTAYAYNLDRQIVRTILPDSSFIDVIYDSTGCVTCGGGSEPKEIIFDRGMTTFNYSSTTGQMSEIVSPTLDTLRYTYDGSLPTSVAWSGSVNGSVNVTYNNDFRVITQSLNGSNMISFDYDDDGFLMNAGDLAINHDSQNGLMTGTTLSNVSTNYTYNEYGEVTGISARYKISDIFSTSYHLDEIGRIDTLYETIQGEINQYVYSYDLASRLLQVDRNDTTISVYSYDDNGNRLNFTDQNGTIFGAYDAQDRMLSYGNASYGYTANGSLRYRAIDGDTTWYAYDNFGNLVSVLLTDGTIIEYIIDGQNRRIGKLVNGVFKKGWLYQDQITPIAELDSLGNISARFVYGSKGHVPDYMIKDDATYAFITDHLGNVRFLVDVATGDIVQSILYNEFGKVLSNTNPKFQSLAYAGGLYDEQTELVRFGYRDYDAMTGRWTSKDPIRFDGKDTNLFGYCVNDPINYFDPEGLLFFGLINAGESWGLEAAQYYASVVADPCASTASKIGAWAGGLFASLWTPDTSDKTFITLSSALSVSGWASRTGPWLGKVAFHTHAGPHQYPHLQIMIRTGSHVTKHIRIPPHWLMKLLGY